MCVSFPPRPVRQNGVTGILLIQDLAVVLVIAGAAAWLCQRLGLSAIVGYLVAGTVIGPNTPPFALVADSDRVQTLAQVGLVFLVFSIGLTQEISVTYAVPGNQPLLVGTREGSNLILTWPTNDSDFKLEYATNLPISIWISNLATPSVVNRRYTLTNSMTNNFKIYRLKK